jgi:transforming growth factor-beta-induced protein
MTRWIRAAIAALGVSFLAACGGDDDPASPTPSTPPPAQSPGTIAEVATRNGLTALVAAADKAGLVPTLSSSAAELTVLAPTDVAFTNLARSLGFASATAMVQALPADALASILQYHVIAGRASAAQVIAGGTTQPTLYTFDGSPARLGVDTTRGVAFTDAVLTQAKVVAADVAASNGVVHLIDKVLVPPGVLNIVQMAQANPAFSTLVGAVVARDLVPTLSGTGPFTVFAPTDDAFAAIQSTVAALTSDQLTTVLTYHVLAGEVLSTGIPFGSPVTTVAAPRTITITAGPAPAIASIADSTASPAGIIAVDIRASNGVIHVIDKVLIPSPL